MILSLLPSRLNIMMNERLFRIMNGIYEHIFGYSMGGRARLFFKNLGITTFGFGAASFLTFGLTIFAGRLLGPIEYGKANLVFSISSFLAVPMGLWLNLAAIKYLASESRDTTRDLIASLLVLTFLSTIVSIPVIYFLQDQFLILFHVGKGLFFFAVIFSLILVFTNVGQTILKGLHLFKKFASIHLISLFFFIAPFFVYFFIVGGEDFYGLVIPSGIRLLLIGTLALWVVREYLRLGRFQYIRALSTYSLSGVIGIIPSNFSFGVVDQLLINYFLGPVFVGIYSAYFIFFQVINNKGFEVLLAVFFPVVASITEKKAIFIKMNRLLVYSFLPAFFLIFLFMIVLLPFFGETYPIDLSLVILFALGILISLIASLYGWFVASIGSRALRIVSFNLWVGASINFLLAWFLIPRIGLHGAIIALIASSCYYIGAFFIYFLRYDKSVYGISSSSTNVSNL